MAWNSNRWSYVNFYFSESCHLFLAFFLTYAQKFSRLVKQVWSLGFVCSTLRSFCSVFLFDVLKWDSTIYQIYWIPNLQLLKLFCFTVANTWKRKYANSWQFFWQGGHVLYLIEDYYVRKYFKYWFFRSFIKILNLLTKGVLMNSRTW